MSLNDEITLNIYLQVPQRHCGQPRLRDAGGFLITLLCHAVGWYGVDVPSSKRRLPSPLFSKLKKHRNCPGKKERLMKQLIYGNFIQQQGI